MSAQKACILVVDDEPKICYILSDILTFKGYQVLTAHGGKDALQMLKKEKVDLILLDLMMPDMSGKEVLQHIIAAKMDLPVVMISAHGTIKTAVEAIKEGAYDFIEKPLDADRILITVKNALDKRDLSLKTDHLKKDLLSRYQMIGTGKAIKKVFNLIDLYAPTNVSVLITGESGTGKELVAQALHTLSPRVGYPMIKINCASIPNELVESELFGYEKGAFTGAMATKKGKIELAQNSTLFMDEIGDLNPGTQAKLLRLIEQQELERLGGLKTIWVDFRLIAATNKDLEAEVRKGKFREDLFYRLDIARIHLPPLRERREDIPLLARHFIEEFCFENNIRDYEITPDLLESLTRYSWPGNVRELKNYLHKILILSQNGPGQLQVPVKLLSPGSDWAVPYIAMEGRSLKEARSEFEKRYISDLLNKFAGNITRTAHVLQIDRSHLHKKIKELGIEIELSE